MDTRAAIERRATDVRTERSGAIETDQEVAVETFEVEFAETAPAWRRLLDAEPARVAGFVTALIVLAVAFGAPISPEQKAAILGFVASAMALVQAEVTRQAVSSPATVADMEAEADEAIKASYRFGVEDAEAGRVALAEIG